MPLSKSLTKQIDLKKLGVKAADVTYDDHVFMLKVRGLIKKVHVITTMAPSAGLQKLQNKVLEYTACFNNGQSLR